MCEDCVPMFPPFWRVLDMGLASGHSSRYVPSLRQWLKWAQQSRTPPSPSSRAWGTEDAEAGSEQRRD